MHFANLFFTAYAADLDGREISLAWAPLFEARRGERIQPIQFALAWMSAHISHDLPHAVVDTCASSPSSRSTTRPSTPTSPRATEVLGAAQEEIKAWFSTGIVATVDRLGGRVDDGFATFGIHLARAHAWQTSELCGASPTSTTSTASSAPGSAGPST